MRVVYYLFLTLLKIVSAKINIDVVSDTNGSDVIIKYSGMDIRVVNEEDINLFNIDEDSLIEAVTKHYKRKPSNVYLKKPTPWELYKTYKWEEVTRVLMVKSARVKSIHKTPVVVISNDFENNSERTIKVNTGMNQEVENTMTTSWSKSKELGVTQEIEYNLNVIWAKASGSTAFSYVSNWGESEEKSETVTIGSTSAVETELKPGEAVTAVLSANRGYLEVDIIYGMFLRGNVAVNFKKSFRDHHFWGPPVENVMEAGGLPNERTTIETIKVGFYTDASVKVYDKVTGLPR